MPLREKEDTVRYNRFGKKLLFSIQQAYLRNKRPIIIFAMKKSVVIFLFLMIIVAATPLAQGVTSLAVSTPYAVIGEDVWLLAESGSKLFLLPKTYYARIDRMDDGFYYVTFNGVSGKIPKQSVSVVGYDKPVKDTQKIIRIAPEYAVFTEIKLVTALEGEGKEELAPTSEPLTYLGTYKQGETVWYYVSFGGKYGYVKNTYTDSPEIGFEDFKPVSDEKTEEPNEQTEPTEKKSELVKILVISGVSAVALIFVIILFLPRKNKKHRYYYS